MQCKFCSGNRFEGHMVERHAAVFDGDGNWQEDCECYDSGNPYGPFTCLGCGAEYEELDDSKCNELPTVPAVTESMDEVLAALKSLKETKGDILDMCMDVAWPIMQNGDSAEDAIRLAMAIHRAEPWNDNVGVDFSVYDYVDAIINLPPGVNFSDVMDATYLPVERFNDLLTTMAQEKRTAYTGDWERVDDLQSILHDMCEAIRAPLDQATIAAAKERQQKDPDFPFRG